jgi:hypothetical protein
MSHGIMRPIASGLGQRVLAVSAVSTDATAQVPRHSGTAIRIHTQVRSAFARKARVPDLLPAEQPRTR